MSWRIVILPADLDAATAHGDAVIPFGATDAEVDAVADKWAWQLPLKVFTPSEDDSRFIRLVSRLTGDEVGMSREHFTVYVKPGRVMESTVPVDLRAYDAVELLHAGKRYGPVKRFIGIDPETLAAVHSDSVDGPWEPVRLIASPQSPSFDPSRQ